jgi:hypothetical protein
MKRSKLTDEDLLVALERMERASELADANDEYRVQSLGAYRGENLRPAPEGRSQVVDRTTWEVVESVKPQILKLFLSGDEVVRFDPTGPEDIKPAELESAAVNHVVTQQNPAFNTFSGWLHDGLLHRNGYVLTYWDESDEIERESYSGLSDEELALIAKSDDVTLVSLDSQQMPVTDAMGNVLGVQAAHNVVVERKEKRGRVRIVNVPPETILVDANHSEVSLARAVFVQHRAKKTLSELREMGFDVEDDISDDGPDDESWVDDYRREYTAIRDRGEGEEAADPSMREVLVRESWVRLDKDGDGVASLYRTVVIGKTLLLCEDADHIPVIAWCPIPQPHMHQGFSLYDEVREIQDIKTAIIRTVLDQLYTGTHGRWAVDPDRVNLDDLLVSRPNGIVRTEGDPAGSMMPMMPSMNLAPAMQMAEYMDVQRELRTGIPRVQQGQIDPLSQNKTATGISQVFAAGQQRIELIARYFAEAVKELCLVTHQLLSKHSRKPLMLQLKQQFIPVDPRQWAKRTDMTISVGLGSGSRMEQTAFLQQLLTLMIGPGLQIGITDPSKIHNAVSKMINAVGYRNPEEFLIDPANAPPKPPPPPDPKMIEVQQKGQIAQAELQQRAQADQQSAQAMAALEQYKADLMAQAKRYEADLDARTKIEIARIQQEYATQREAMRPQNYFDGNQQ